MESRYGDYIESVTKICKNTRAGESYIQSETPMFNFDKISNAVNVRSGFHSADALRIRAKCIELIEFKSGFARRITKENWDPKRASCPDDPEKECLHYKKVFLRLAKLEVQELLDTIKSKAVESFVTWEKCILPQVPADRPIPIKYIVIIDADNTDGYENIMGDLAKKSVAGSNQVANVKQALKRFVQCRDANNSIYYYDSVEVYTFSEYQHILNTEKK